ncbi:class II SORL domain-containing protein [Clostridium sp. D2Q-11]|uniref:Class II SORL domain-containing protein n=1 Tax=Anaeromonas frigoriresistens TaxID=2683708 RepID=A0A942UXY6_9FIRM|nr:class II SORL domain-containing protein [Anaeromonas frigoriresistens]MBS4537657.1 class II SORL domain-containing protein [Anaeromonas frigoriresistens]
MQNLGQLIQTGDWKGEKHVPVIHLPRKVKKGKDTEIRVSIGDEVKHPNSLEHHIKWMKVFYFAEDGKFPIQLSSFEFTAHGESDVYTEPVGVTSVILDKPGVIYVQAYCNIHGLWENSIEIIVE